MSSNSKQILFGLAIGAILMFFLQQCPAGSDQALTDDEKMAVLDDSLRYFRDETGRLVATTQTLESTIGDLADSLDRGSLLIAELRRKEAQYQRKLRDVTAISTRTQLTVPVDSVFVFVASETRRDTVLLFAGPMTEVTAQPDKEGKPEISVSLTDRVVVTHAYGKGGLFKRKPLSVYVENTNEHVKIVGAKSLAIPHPQRRVCAWLKGLFQRKKAKKDKG